ncbi:MAG: hypothetical protein IPI06_03880 [Gammaproteobacteria bacterium]|nr:hypothetical protein [Gammaproteobacteria bacterium]
MKESDTVAGVQLGARLIEESVRWNADLDVAGVHREYLENTYPSSTLAWVLARASATILPRHVTWELQDNYGQTAADAFGAIEPNDRQNTNFFTTGPNLRFAFGRLERLDIQGRYSDVRYSETSDLNNHRVSGSATVVHRWTAIRQVSLEGYTEHVTFDRDDLFRNYDLRSAFLALRSDGRRTVTELSLGASEVDDGRTTRNSTLASLALTHRLTAVSSVEAYVRRGFSDSADSFRIGQGGTEQVLIDQNVQVVAQPFVETRLDLSFVAALRRSSYRLSTSVIKEDYQDLATLNRKRIQIDARANYVWASLMRTDLFATYSKGTYELIARDTRDVSFGLAVVQPLQGGLDVILRLERYDRSSDVNPFAENRAVLALTWSPPRRAMEEGPARNVFDRIRGTNSQSILNQ